MSLNNSPIRVKSFEFACEIVHFTDKLKENKDFELVSQLLRSGERVLEPIQEKRKEV
jgi:four helix bundle protein